MHRSDEPTIPRRASPSEGVTPVSGGLRPHTRLSARFGVARLSLGVLAVAPALTACFDAPPEYSVPKPVPPVVLTSLVLPITTEVYRASDTTQAIEFKVP